MKVQQELKLLYKVLMFKNTLETFDKLRSSWNIWKDRVVDNLDTDDKLRYYKLKDGYTKKLLSIVDFIITFARRYECLPVLKCNGDGMQVEFNGRWVKGFNKIFLDDTEWLQEILDSVKILKQRNVFEL